MYWYCQTECDAKPKTQRPDSAGSGVCVSALIGLYVGVAGWKRSLYRNTRGVAPSPAR